MRDTTTTADGSSAQERLNNLLGKPPLIKGENEQQYWRLHSAVESEMKPTTLFDYIRVREITDKLWDQRRNKNSAAVFVETAFISALASLLRERMEPPKARFELQLVSVAEDDSAKAARQYYDSETNPKRRKELSRMLEQYGITEDQIRAKAMLSCSRSLQLFRDMEENCSTAIRQLRKEHQRQSNVDNKAPAKVEADQVEN